MPQIADDALRYSRYTLKIKQVSSGGLRVVKLQTNVIGSAVDYCVLIDRKCGVSGLTIGIKYTTDCISANSGIIKCPVTI